MPSSAEVEVAGFSMIMCLDCSRQSLAWEKWKELGEAMYTTWIDGEAARSSILVWISGVLAWLCLEANVLAVSGFREYTALRVH